jgi:hypothetical protein
MYKILPEDEDRHCLECGELLYGRTDKKFCNTSCKSKYHGHYRSLHNTVYDSTINCLRINYGILEKMFKLNATSCQMKDLREMGFSPDCVTHQTEKKGKHLEYRCFDFVYNLSERKLFNLRRL